MQFRTTACELTKQQEIFGAVVFPLSASPSGISLCCLKLARLEPTSLSQIIKNQLLYYQRLPKTIVAYRAQPSPLFNVWG